VNLGAERSLVGQGVDRVAEGQREPAGRNDDLDGVTAADLEAGDPALGHIEGLQVHAVDLPGEAAANEFLDDHPCPAAA